MRGKVWTKLEIKIGIKRDKEKKRQRIRGERWKDNGKGKEETQTKNHER